ncbi:MAG: NAD-dependent epimerase/dehydratase family protein [Planctomycetes bacterium]|nr:NAD-dependent epimerase/dehydratase family protein [Planctomycetota bacterium]
MLVRRLLANGCEPERLRCLVRDPARAARGGLPEASLVRADLADAACGDAVRAAADGAAVVVHLAGSLKAYDRSGFDEVNVRGTERLVAAVRDAAPDAHFVHVSSLAAAGPSVSGDGTGLPPDRCRTVSRYGESKRLGELAVVGADMPFTVLRPPVVYGPNDDATRLLFRQASAWLTAAPPRPRPLSVIHADDVAEALWCAVLRRPQGAFLPLDGPERTDTHALMRRIAEACGRRARLLPVPMFVAAGAAHAADLWARLRRRASHFNRDKVREIAAPGWVADGAEAKRVLGFEPRVGLDDGLREVARAEGFASVGLRD